MLKTESLHLEEENEANAQLKRELRSISVTILSNG